MLKVNNPLREKGIIPLTSSGFPDYVALNDWYHAHEVLIDTPIYKILCFTIGEHRAGTPVVIVPPYAGHTSMLVDYDKDHSLVESAYNNSDGHIFAIEWKSATRDTHDTTYEQLLVAINDAVRMAGDEPVHLVGCCMGGTLAAVYTAIFKHKVRALTIAGTPINPHACPSELDEALNAPYYKYKEVVAANAGLMKGDLMLMLWMSSDIDRHYLNRPNRYHPRDYKEARFIAWYYENTVDLAAWDDSSWYLWLVKNHFLNNQLFNGGFDLLGVKVDARNIFCPINIVTGDKDTISPAPHGLALAEMVSSSEIRTYTTPGGHIGVFMGSYGLDNVYPKIFSSVK